MRCSVNWSSKEAMVSWNYSISRSWKGISTWIWKTVSVRLGIVGPCWINEGIRFHSRGDASFFTYFLCTLAGLDTSFLVFFLSWKKTKTNLDHDAPDSQSWIQLSDWTELNWRGGTILFFKRLYVVHRIQIANVRQEDTSSHSYTGGFFFPPPICLLYFFNNWKKSDKVEFNLLIPEV